MGSRWTTWSPAMAVLVLSKAGLFSVKRITISTHIITGKVIRSALAWAFDKNVWRSMLTSLQAFACGKWTTYTRPLSEVVGCNSSAPTLTLNMSYLSGYLGWVPSCIMTISKSQLLKCVAPKQNLRSIKFCGLRSSPHIWEGWITKAACLLLRQQIRGGKMFVPCWQTASLIMSHIMFVLVPVVISQHHQPSCSNEWID